MTYTRNHARPLLNDSEYELFTLSLSDRITDLNQAELNKAITRARRARDKASDLVKRQAGKVRQSAGARGGALNANERSKKKEVALSEALGRFEKRAAALEEAEEKAKKREALAHARSASGKGPGKGKGPAGGAKNRAARRAGGSTGFQSDSAGKKAESARRAPQTRINASRSAAGKRGQSRRDSR